MVDTPRYKELQLQLAGQTDEKGRINTLLDIAVEVRNFDVDEAMKIAEEVILRSRAIAYPRGMGRGLNIKGSCHWLKGEYEAGIEVLKESLTIATKLKDKRLEARVLYHLGNIFRDQGDLSNVFGYFERALRIYEELGDEFSQSIILTSISNLLYDLNDYDSALEYALKCLPIFERSHNLNSLINIYNTLGNIYFKKDLYAEALHYFEENLNHSEFETVAFVMAESGLGKVYYKMQHFDNARKYLSNALRQAQNLGNVEVQIICQFYLGRLYMDEDSYRQSLQSLSLAYTLANEYQRRHDLMSIHEVLSMLYDKMGDIPKAFHHLKTFEQLKEEIFKQKTINEVRNLQARQQIELAQKEKEVAERTAFLKHQFMANMSHEIRTPMNAIVGMTRLLLSKEPKPDQLRYLNAIQMSADNLLVIINDILDLSKIEAGKIQMEHVDFTLREVLQSVRDMFMLKAEDKGIELRLTVGDDLPKRLVGDPTRLNQVLVNLVGNAVKFTDKGYVELKTTLREKTGKVWVQFDVVDTGIGISADYVDTIFESFTQAGTDVARRFGGTGLGLTISRQLVTLMGGDIFVRSELQKGTTFTAVIPLDVAEVQEFEKKDNMLDEAAMKRLNALTVLLVEDNDFNRMVAEDTLKEMIPSLTLDIAVNGAEAVDRLKRDTYDIVLMDIQMPVMGGVEATKLIRSTLPEPARSVKIIAMTANVLQEDVQQYFDAGMDAYISKPFHADELMLKMDAVMAGLQPVTNNQQEHKPKAEQLPELPEKVTDRRFLQQFTGGNPEKMLKYINMFLENAPKLMDAIDKAMASGDYPAVKIAAHSLKPQLSYMGVKEEVSSIFMIEQAAGEPAHYDSLPLKIRQLHRVCVKAFDELKN